MNRSTSKRAFTLIELLVVIAIIAILAAILFPVFAQAKMAAKTTVAISNMKQLGTALFMYSNDFDDVNSPPYPLGGGCPDTTGSCHTWRNSLDPYVKNGQVSVDLVNPAAKYLDLASDPLAGAAFGWKVDPNNTPHARSYQRINQFFIANTWGDPGIANSLYAQPASQGMIIEGKAIDPDWCPCNSWDGNGGTGPNYKTPFTWGEPGGVSKGLNYVIGGGKWSDKAFVGVYGDSHAKRASWAAACSLSDPTQYTFFGYRRMDLGPDTGPSDQNWIDSTCTNLQQGAVNGAYTQVSIPQALQ
jgi:prepilin-type N-terminal cleavage/methylation domain-containing protein